MAGTLANVGANMMLKVVFNNAPPTGGRNLTLKLFCNNVTPGNTDTAATYTEATGGGYAAITLTSGSWTVSAQSGIYQAAYAKQTFTFTGALTTNTTVYGYYIVDADGVLFGAERLASSFAPANNGDSIDATPIVKLSYGTPAA